MFGHTKIHEHETNKCLWYVMFENTNMNEGEAKSANKPKAINAYVILCLEYKHA